MTVKHDLDLTQTHFSQQHGDLTVLGAWFGEDLRQCLAIIPTYRRRGFAPVVVLLDDAYLWAAEAGSPFYVQQEAPKMAEALGFDPTPAVCARIANTINDHLGDLLLMPPKPAERYVAADATMIDHNGKERHFEVKDAR